MQAPGYIHPEEYDNINKKLAITREQRNLLFEDFTAPIRDTLDAMGIEYELKTRVKSPYSIWTKMQNKHVTFDEIYDILAVRIIFTPKKREDEINECFQIYVAISKIYKSHPDRLRDWLNHVEDRTMDRSADTLRPYGRGGRTGIRRPLEVQGRYRGG